MSEQTYSTVPADESGTAMDDSDETPRESMEVTTPLTGGASSDAPAPSEGGCMMGLMTFLTLAIAAAGAVPLYLDPDPDSTETTNTHTRNIIATALVIGAALIGMMFASFLYRRVMSITLPTADGDWTVCGATKDAGDDNTNFTLNGITVTKAQGVKMVEIYDEIVAGAKAFLWAEYRICVLFIIIFGALVFYAVSYGGGAEMDYTDGALTAGAFVLGGLTSIVSGYIGMMVAVRANARTAVVAVNEDEGEKYKAAFNAAFRAGGVMGYCLTGLSLLVLYAMCNLFSLVHVPNEKESAMKLFECVAGFGLGGSAIAMFGRVGGGIYTKAADVGADLAGKVIHGIPEDDPRNPATIADNVGDNVGDVAGMGSDLFGSFAEATCAALVVSASSAQLVEHGWGALMFPLHISALGIVVCMLTSFLATNISPVRQAKDVEKVLKVQLAVTTALMTAVLYPAAHFFLPASFVIERVSAHLNIDTDFPHTDLPDGIADLPGEDQIIHIDATPLDAFVCIAVGLWAGCIIGFVTEFYTSHSYSPTREVAYSCETGAATNMIYGLSLGYKSVIIPVCLLAIVSYVSFTLCDMYGVALAALGMLATLSCCLSIDVYGPVCDNAGGVAEMSELDEQIRDCTDELDAAGNTTAAIGKGFAIGSATLVGLALFGAFITRSGLTEEQTSILSPMVFSCLLLGAMIPYWFTAMTMKSVGVAANAMVKEVSRQFLSADATFKGTRADLTEDQINAAIEKYAKECDKNAPGRKITAEDVTHKEMKAHLKLIIDKEEPPAQDWNIVDGDGEVKINLIMAKLALPMNAECISISTDASLSEMVPPAALVMGSPLTVGVLLGTDAVAGLLAGAIVSSVQLAISASNSGGAWDNAKKYVEKGEVWLPKFHSSYKNGKKPLPLPEDGITDYVPKGGAPDERGGAFYNVKKQCDTGEGVIRYCHGKGTEVHSAAVAGDTVGDPFKDTSGPALNIVMKLMAILSLVFADFFVQINDGHGLLQLAWPRLPEILKLFDLHIGDDDGGDHHSSTGSGSL
jgi:inorganic pyrophosphatase